jgi:hypothetical protein
MAMAISNLSNKFKPGFRKFPRLYSSYYQAKSLARLLNNPLKLILNIDFHNIKVTYNHDQKEHLVKNLSLPLNLIQKLST